MILSTSSRSIPPTAMLRAAIPADSKRLAELVAMASHGIAPYLRQMMAPAIPHPCYPYRGNVILMTRAL